ncbi:MAG: hypothetical protein A2758_02020 [Candidatus Zambryskibacteria bacterium RIFCSPHIGHO2_01_FULL_49_18]|uniref:Nudix hydrolase domain-containing protein n=2 Tax=Candidatus Zambryskiibacteriota TaxID=1817925 RepID=A0A1G2T341_9BACT|nr:MAG: hypothetical protein A2758_02020 [Candidatus Zambryskibacteria bacterium RIFCSPHIGHO2_01_FULL_49_18]OHB06111.1 MAG: hypothetical protein A3A26_00980 [Candidatus Zambryskibacteria bacterium RIFCSPLOWO2_01_FULL_47_14]
MSPEKSHFVCAVIWRKAQSINGIKAYEFLVIDSVSTDRVGRKSNRHVKFPGGMNRVREESVELTLQREVLEETHLALLPDMATELCRIQSGPDHTKYGFLVRFDDCRGRLRSESLHDNGDEMSEPRWVPADVLGRELFEKHQPFFMEACRRLGIF